MGLQFPLLYYYISHFGPFIWWILFCSWNYSLLLVPTVVIFSCCVIPNRINVVVQELKWDFELLIITIKNRQTQLVGDDKKKLRTVNFLRVDFLCECDWWTMFWDKSFQVFMHDCKLMERSELWKLVASLLLTYKTLMGLHMKFWERFISTVYPIQNKWNRKKPEGFHYMFTLCNNSEFWLIISLLAFLSF